MTRVAIVAASEELRAALAEALRADPDFEVVSAVAAEREVSPLADGILVARSVDAPRLVTATQGADSVETTVLTNREREILALLADGLGNKQIAARIGIYTNTVKTHLELLFDKLGVSSRAEAVATGVRRGLLML